MSYISENMTDALSGCRLATGQIRALEVAHNALWVASDGTVVGWGDLSSDDLEGVALTLEGDEALLVLPEAARYEYPVGSLVPADEMARLAHLVVTECDVEFVIDDRHADSTHPGKIRGLEVGPVTRSHLLARLQRWAEEAATV